MKDGNVKVGALSNGMLYTADGILSLGLIVIAEAEIAEQVRELQAQEFASGFVGAMAAGEVNQYADT